MRCKVWRARPVCNRPTNCRDALCHIDEVSSEFVKRSGARRRSICHSCVGSGRDFHRWLLPRRIPSLIEKASTFYRLTCAFEDRLAKLRKQLRRIVHHSQHREHEHNNDDCCPRAKAELVNPIAHGTKTPFRADCSAPKKNTRHSVSKSDDAWFVSATKRRRAGAPKKMSAARPLTALLHAVEGRLRVF
jgi:hypothetical protein